VTAPVLIMAGGTGGHVFPALAVARALREGRREVVWLGTRRGIEARLVPAAGIPVEWIEIEGLRGRGAGRWLSAPVRLARAVMQAVAQMSDWKRKRPAGRALGFAYSDAWDAHCAQVAEVSVDRKTGKIRVHEVWCAVDPGVALQPKNIEAQIESAVMYGVSHALLEQITFSGGEVKQSNFHDYPIMRMNEAPKVTTKVMPTDNPPSGMGEVGLPPVGAAIANAVAVITGKRLRSLPLDANLLKA